ncbi:hypothetical protein [Sanguibacter sp. 25GB23B1]|uniref:hypothetical protein n=1 Tax=unclassified Sanguibacter TaxID=2645534 RepID=UPI0032AF6E54
MSDGIKKLARNASGKIDKIDSEKIKGQASDVVAALSDGAHQAGDVATVFAGQAREAAVQAKDWSTPKVEAFVEWVTPRFEQAWNETLKATAPRVEKAAEKAAPVIDSAHDKIVDDLLPKFVAALNAAAESAADAAVHGVAVAGSKTSAGATHLADSIAAASERGPLKLAEAAKAAEKHSKKSGKGWWIVGGVAAAGGAYVLWKRSQPTTDPWAEPWEKVDAHSFDEVVDDAKVAVGDAAEAVGEAAGAAVAKSREVSGKVAGSVEELSEKVTDKLSEAKATAKKATTRTRAAAKDKVDETAPVVEDALASAADAVPGAAETAKHKVDDAGDATDSAIGDTDTTK